MNFRKHILKLRHRKSLKPLKWRRTLVLLAPSVRTFTFFSPQYALLPFILQVNLFPYCILFSEHLGCLTLESRLAFPKHQIKIIDALKCHIIYFHLYLEVTHAAICFNWIEPKHRNLQCFREI